MSIFDQIDKQDWANYVLNLVLRAFGVGFRFLVPVVLIASGASEELGLYYLALSIMAGISIFGGMELGLFYSIEHKNNKDPQSIAPTLRFFYVLCAFNIILSVIAITLGVFFSEQLPKLFFLIVIALSIESISYELGRFLWNLGEVEKVSRRDFLRPFIFMLSILVSLHLYSKIITTVSLLIFIFANIAILIYESRKYLGVKKLSLNLSWAKDIATYNSISKFFYHVGPQFLQNQLLSVILIVERLLFTVTVGLVFLGSYAFIFSIVSVLSHLLYMPKMVKVRERIIADQLSLSNIETYVESIKFLLPVSLITFFIVMAIILIGPFVADYFGQALDFDPMILTTIGVTSAIYAYNAAVSPLFSHKTRWLKANLLTLFALTPMLAVIYLHNLSSFDVETLVLGAVLISAIMQLLFRLNFFKSRVNALSN